MQKTPLEHLVFLNECGFALNLHRFYGWSERGKRLVEEVPFNKGENRSVLGAYAFPTPQNPTGLWALWPKLGAWTGVLVVSFIEEELLPRLAPGSVLVLDNARIHYHPNLAAKVEAAGCCLLYLPPYSPDFNPIELVWSWIKDKVRELAPRTDDQRKKDIYTVRDALPSTAAQGWFEKAGLY